MGVKHGESVNNSLLLILKDPHFFQNLWIILLISGAFQDEIWDASKQKVN